VATQAVADNASLQAFSSVSLSDPDSGAIETITIQLTGGDGNGTLSGTGVTKTGTGKYALTAGTPASVTTALRAVTFTPTNHEVAPGTATTTSVTLSVSDGIASAVTATTNIVATAQNTAPTVTGLAATESVADNVALAPFAAVTVSDPDNNAATSAIITLTNGGTATDADGILSGAGLTRTGTGSYSLVATNPANLSARLQALVFTPAAHQVAPGSNVVTGISLAVAEGSAVTTATTALTASAQNTAPSITGLPASESGTDNAALTPFSAVTVADSDVSAANSASIILTSGGGATDADGLLSGTGLSKTGTGTYSLAATSPANLSSQLRALVFTPVAHQVAPGSNVATAFGVTVAEGSATSSASTLLTATAQNTAPTVVSLPATEGVADNATVTPFAAVTVGDPDIGAATSASITLTSGGTASDANGILSGQGLTKTGVGTYGLVATTPANLTVALKGLTFAPTAHQVAPGSSVTTGISLAVADGSAITTATTILTASAQSTAPTVTGLPASESGTDNATLAPFGGILVADLDKSAATSATIVVTSAGVATDAGGLLSGTGLTKTGGGTYSLAATSPANLSGELRALVFTPTAHQVAPGGSVTTAFGLTVAEGAATTNASTILTATAQNTAPIVIGVPATASVADNATLAPFTAVSVSDPDVNAATSASIILTSGGTATDADGILSGPGLTKTGVGIYGLAATNPASLSAGLRALSFTPTAHQVAPGNNVATDISLTVAEGSAITTATTTLTATARNTAPSVTGLPSSQSGIDTASLVPFGAIAITDPDNGAAISASVTLTGGGAATDADGILSGAGLTRPAPAPTASPPPAQPISAPSCGRWCSPPPAIRSDPATASPPSSG
jgi:plastocyanin